MPSLLPGLDVGIQDVHLNRKVMDVMRNSKSQVRGVPGQRHVGRAVAAGARRVRRISGRWPMTWARRSSVPFDKASRMSPLRVSAVACHRGARLGSVGMPLLWSTWR